MLLPVEEPLIYNTCQCIVWQTNFFYHPNLRHLPHRLWGLNSSAINFPTGPLSIAKSWEPWTGWQVNSLYCLFPSSSLYSECFRHMVGEKQRTSTPGTIVCLTFSSSRKKASVSENLSRPMKHSPV